ncbi:hypothetical protein FMM05_09825 [Flavobacterium zepuense]|uniref:EF-hand domain-containing protein n=1 Tax=Flavobacterium zepuense TaxID=2593302 RepID=A0A552V2V1_9FLAO|nr:hypothetical protein [Flavobacterium zepuense]TRW24787.1 hypothetical protein FMM05_09825 [Flavobacterium zepuense]
MKKAAIIALAFTAALFVSCKEEKPKPKVIYRDTKAVKAQPKKVDSTQIKVADLPVLMDGTKYLIHPVGDIRIYDDSNRSYGSSRTTGSVSYAISNYNRFEITGYFENLKFQHVDSTTLRPLTTNKIQIQTATYLNSLSDRTKKQVLVYTLVDADTNQDGKVDSNDIKSLYISEISGKGFKKLSEDVQELVDWNIIDAQNRIYFRTIEDINKNGAFDKNDMVHYHYADLMAKDWAVTDYKPVE